MKDPLLASILISIALFALLSWLGIDGHDITRLFHDLGHGGNNSLFSWALLALIGYTVIKVIQHITK